MSRLPDRFDLWVRKARECPDPVRQLDYVLGALAAQDFWFFPNLGTKENPQPPMLEDDGRFFLVFSEPDRLLELTPEAGIINIPFPAALTWCLEQQAGILVNPGTNSVLVPFAHLRHFHLEWQERGGRLASGFWIPELTSEEEDFWQENGL